MICSILFDDLLNILNDVFDVFFFAVVLTIKSYPAIFSGLYGNLNLYAVQFQEKITDTIWGHLKFYICMV